MFNYDFIGNCIYTALLILIYVFVYRLLGYSFTGSLSLSNHVLFLATSFFIVSIGLFISNFFSSKYGNLIAYLLFFIQISFQVEPFYRWTIFHLSHRPTLLVKCLKITSYLEHGKAFNFRYL